MIAIGEAARRSGVSVETIRYYEREGITGKPGRTPGGRRVYNEHDIGELRFIKRCRDLGFSVRDTVTLRRLAEADSGACDEVAALGRTHLEQVRAKITALGKLENALDELVSNCLGGSASCPLLEALMRDERGPG